MKLRRRDPTHVHPIGFHDLLRGLERGLTMFADAEPRAALVALYLKFEEELRADLRDFIRKRDYRFQDEPRDLEQESWWRAPLLVVGCFRCRARAAP